MLLSLGSDLWSANRTVEEKVNGGDGKWANQQIRDKFKNKIHDYFFTTQRNKNN